MNEIQSKNQVFSSQMATRIVVGTMLVLSLIGCGNQAAKPEVQQADQQQKQSQPNTDEPSDTQAPKPKKLQLDEAQLNHYVALQEKLAADNFAEAQKAALALVESCEGELKTLAAPMSKAADIAALRTEFRPLSESVKDQKLPAGFVTAYCPMAFKNTGAYWLQKGSTLYNPYYGAEMLHCGAITRKGSAEQDAATAEEAPKE
ncbi:DUF3347 domain-containing protein [Sulfidibacter corallicola]|uniref:DUF3347 domain-containing protein n=1 Tax=Sulfidibacter corallicola TaxID=2818388 RepID=A0A8A4TW10_SULCO|nr:hypothetical protein [Sulfidibacter corallicola]QTD54129.1 DUF3347 domain-containing protein [Sulfidibacter corallicola]